jgi:hypothetical protein
MSILEAGRRSATLHAARLGILVLAGCTTTEGTNALQDAGTFEREVLTSTLRGVGVLNKQTKPDDETTRAPLVLPRSTASLPAPTQGAATQLPPDSSNVQIDTSNLSDADLQRLRNARVVDLRSLGGRPLTDAESAQLTARMTAANMQVTANANRPLYLPPDEYFSTVGGQDLVCLAANGSLVKLDDPNCPPEIRAALSRQ